MQRGHHTMNPDTVAVALLVVCSCLSSCWLPGSSSRPPEHASWPRVAPRAPELGEREPGYVARVLLEDPLAYFDFREVPDGLRAPGALASVDGEDAALLGSRAPVRLMVPMDAPLTHLAMSVMARPERAAAPGAADTPAAAVTPTELVRYEVDGVVHMSWRLGPDRVRVELGDEVYQARLDHAGGQWRQLGVVVGPEAVDLTHQGRWIGRFERARASELPAGGVWSMRCEGWSCDELSVHDMPVNHTAWWQALSRVDEPPAPRAEPTTVVHHARGHAGRVDAVRFGPGGATIASVSEAEAIIWDARTGQILHTLTGHTEDIRDLAFSPDGALLATASNDGTARIWDVWTGRQVHALEGNAPGIGRVVFAPDGKTMATGSIFEGAQLWDPRAGRLLHSVGARLVDADDASYRPDGGALALVSRGGVEVWDVRTGALIREARLSRRPIEGVAYSPDGATLAMRTRRGAVVLWDLDADRVLHEFEGEGAAVMEFGPDGSTLAIGSIGSSSAPTRVWDTRTGELVRELTPCGEYACTLRFDRGGATLMATTRDDSIAIWDLRTGRRVASVADSSRALDLSPDASRVVTSREGIRVWDASTGDLVRTLAGQRKMAWVVEFAPDGHTLASLSSDGLVRRWDARTGELRESFDVGPTGASAFDPAHAWVATGSSRDHAVRIWDARTGALGRVLEGHQDAVVALSYSPDGVSVLTGAADGEVRLWDTRAGRAVHVMGRQGVAVDDVAFAPDGATAAVSFRDGVVELYDARTAQLLRTLGSAREGSGFEVHFSPDGSRLTVGTVITGKEVVVWDTQSGKPVYYLWDRHAPARFSPRGEVLVTASSGRYGPERAAIVDPSNGHTLHRLDTDLRGVRGIAYHPARASFTTVSYAESVVRVWDASTGRLIDRLEGHRGGVWSVGYDPGGAALVTGSTDGTLGIWDVAPDVGAREWRRRARRPLERLSRGHLLINLGTSGGGGVAEDLFARADEDPGVASAPGEPPAEPDAGVEAPGRGEGDSRSQARLFLNHAFGVRAIPSGEFAAPEDLDLDALSGSRGLTPFSLAQIAPRYNRPDLVLRRTGYDDAEHLAALQAQWRRRLELLGLDEQEMVRGGAPEPPRVTLSEVTRRGGLARLTVRAADRVGLVSYQIRVNGVPVLPGGRAPIRGRRHQAAHEIALTHGANVIEVSALSTRGVESRRERVTLEHEDPTRPTLYFVGLGVSEYDDPGIQDLRFAHQDVLDVAAALERVHQESGYAGFEALVPDQERLTRGVLERARAFLARARPRDTVVVMVSGHGTYSREAAPRYFFVARDTDPGELVSTGVALDELEDVLASTLARKRVMFMDTCASGDLADATLRRLAAGGVGGARQRGMSARSITPIPLATAQDPRTKAAAREWIHQRGFVHRDLANRTGATVLSSSRGFELSWESERWRNGAFTEALLEGLGARARAPRGDAVSLDDLAEYVVARTGELTEGRQHPAVDRDNPLLELTFRP